MERKHHSLTEIYEILQQIEDGLPIDVAAEQFGISKATLYRWKKKALASDNTELKKLARITDENNRLKNLLADAALEIHALKEKLQQTL
ncbi:MULTISPECIES: transposase [Sneathiella]|jgi:putative transposase|uniref:transposase n=1 Tax=Sneathiella TaxID=510690 RepID=UPI00146C215F|nr:transposase [Sneathiella aquimaris]